MNWFNSNGDLQVEDYPTLLFYPAADKSNPVIYHRHYNLTLFILFVSLAFRCLMFVFTLQIKLSTKSGVKELAASINKIVKAQNKVTKDEL